MVSNPQSSENSKSTCTFLIFLPLSSSKSSSSSCSALLTTLLAMPDPLDISQPSSPVKNNVSSHNGTSQKDSARHSPVAPLAPLEYLQNQRRGSITDPSLHAASTHSSSKLNTSYRQQPEPHSASPGTSSAHHESSSKTHQSDPRPASPYVFGDATVHPADSIRKLLHSPSSEQRTSPSLLHENSRGNQERNVSGGQGLILRSFAATCSFS